MALILLAVFIGLPLIEIVVFIEVGGVLGVWPTIAATVATALAGSLLLRAQGLATLMRARAQMDQGQLPAREMFEGICLVLAGGLLLTPGFITDTLGLLLFVPPFRELLRRFIGHRLAQRAGQGRTRVFVDGQEINPNSWDSRTANKPRGGHGRGKPGGGGVIEGEFEEVDRPRGPEGPNGKDDPDHPRRLGP